MDVKKSFVKFMVSFFAYAYSEQLPMRLKFVLFLSSNCPVTKSIFKLIISCSECSLVWYLPFNNSYTPDLGYTLLNVLPEHTKRLKIIKEFIARYFRVIILYKLLSKYKRKLTLVVHRSDLKKEAYRS